MDINLHDSFIENILIMMKYALENKTDTVSFGIETDSTSVGIDVTFNVTLKDEVMDRLIMEGK